MTSCKFIVCICNLHVGKKNVSIEMTKISAGLAKNKGVYHGFLNCLTGVRC